MNKHDDSVAGDTVDENADYDVGQHKQNQPKRFGKDNNEFTAKGTADMKNRQTTPRHGDNPMEQDGGKLVEFVAPESTLDRLHRMLNQADVSDEDIRHGAIDLTPKGYNKVASWLGIGLADVKTLLNSLITKVRNDDDQMLRDDYQSTVVKADDDDEGVAGGKRFQYESDALGNVTVHDTETGRGVYLQGSQGMELLRHLNQHPETAQQRLAMLAPLMEATTVDDGYHRRKAERGKDWQRQHGQKWETCSACNGSGHYDRRGGPPCGACGGKGKVPGRSPSIQEAADDADSFLPEIHAQTDGVYNFEWTYGDRYGIAKARFAEHDGQMRLALREIYDAKGTPVAADPTMRHDLLRQARAAAARNDI